MEEKKVSRLNHHGETPLHTASRRGNAQRAKYLLKIGADVNAQDNVGKP